LIPQREKRTIRRGEPRGRREDETFIKLVLFLAFLKKTLCGLRVLCGSIFFSSLAEREIFIIFRGINK
jgi:hypothetical protein